MDVRSWRVLCLAAILGVSVQMWGGPPAAATPASWPEVTMIVSSNLSSPVMKVSVEQPMLQKYHTHLVYQDLLAAETYTKILAQRSNPVVSVAVMALPQLILGQRAGLWAPLDDGVKQDAAQHIAAVAREGGPLGSTAIGIAMTAPVLAWNTEIFKQKGFAPPTGIADLMRPEFKGHVGLTSTTSGVGIDWLIMFARYNGGNEVKIEPGFAFAQQLVRQQQVTTFPTSSANFNAALQRGDIWIGTTYDAGGRALKLAGGPIEYFYPKDAVIDVSGAAVVKNAPYQAQAQRFLNELLAPPFQAAYAGYKGNAVIPVRLGLHLPSDVAATQPSAEQLRSGFKPPDWAYVASQRGAWSDRWIKTIENKQ